MEHGGRQAVLTSRPGHAGLCRRLGREVTTSQRVGRRAPAEAARRRSRLGADFACPPSTACRAVQLDCARPDPDGGIDDPLPQACAGSPRWSRPPALTLTRLRHRPTTASDNSQRQRLEQPAARTSRFLGALTGDCRRARPEHGRRHQARPRRVQRRRTPTARSSVKEFDSQGDPDKATPLATQIVNDDSIIGLVGPGFSGESLATGKTFVEAGLPIDLPVGHQRRRSPSRAGPPGTASSATTRPRARPTPSTSPTPSGAKKVFVDRRRLGLRQGPGRQGQGGRSAAAVDRHRHRAAGPDRLLRRPSPRSRPPAPTPSSTAATTPRPACSSSSCARRGFKGMFMSGDGSEDPAFVKAAGAQAAKGAILPAPGGSRRRPTSRKLQGR